MTVAFWDISGFSNLCNKLISMPSDITELTNKYFDNAITIVKKYNGIIDKSGNLSDAKALKQNVFQRVCLLPDPNASNILGTGLPVVYPFLYMEHSYPIFIDSIGFIFSQIVPIPS